MKKKLNVLKNSPFIKKISDFIRQSYLFFNENKLLFIYIFGCLLNGIILRVFTTGNILSISPIFADLFITIFFASFYFLFKKKWRNVYLYTMTILTTLICICNIVYYHYYSSFISITFISFALTNHETGDSNVVGNLVEIKYLIPLWFPVCFYLFDRKQKKHKEFLKAKRFSKNKSLRYMYIWSLVFLGLLLTTLKGVDYGRFYTQWNREYLVNKFGVYLYQVNDVVKSIEPKMATLFGSDRVYKEVNEFYSDRSDKQNYKNEYTNALKGKNVIAIHSESMQNVLINMKINGTEITPNLNKLTQEGIYFSNFHPQVSFGTSSDTEFTMATSLLPVKSGSVFINYSDKKYVSMYKLLKEKGYYTFSMHANTGDFWNRNIMHKNLGYDKFYEKKSYVDDENIGFGLSDRSFMRQSVEYIKQINKEHKLYYGTMITLSNHTPFSYNELFEKLDLTMTVNGKKYPYMENTKLGDYFVSAHYADAQIGYLISLLEENNLLDNTVIVIYGDHDARISTSMWNRYYNYDYETDDVLDSNDKNYKELDYYWQELNRSTPLIIWSKDEGFKTNYAKKVDTAMGMYDVSVTLGNMLGVYNKYALGTDVMDKKDNLVVFPNGNYLTNYVYYNNNKGQYKLLKNTPLSENYIKKNKQKADQILEISNNIIVYNYFEKVLSNSEYIKEK